MCCCAGLRRRCKPHSKPTQVKQIQMSRAASESLSQHYQLAIAQRRNNKKCGTHAVPHSSPCSLLSPQTRGRGCNRGTNSPLPASVQAKVSHAMQKLLPASQDKSTPPVGFSADACRVEASNPKPGIGLESLSEYPAAPTALHQQAVRVKASAEAVLHGIDWATQRADARLATKPLSRQHSGHSSCATSSSPQDMFEVDAQCEVTGNVSDATDNGLSSNVAVTQSQRSRPGHQFILPVSVPAQRPSKRKNCSKAGRSHCSTLLMKVQKVGVADMQSIRCLLQFDDVLTPPTPPARVLQLVTPLC